MKTTFAVVAALGAISLVCACEEDKKPGSTSSTTAPSAASATAAPVTPPAPKASPAELAAKGVKSLAEGWNAHDPAKISALYEPTAILIVPGRPNTAGREAILANAKDNFDAYPDFKLAVTKTFTNGNTTAFEWVVTGKNDGPLPGQTKPSGKQIGVAGVSVATFDDAGLIKEEHRYVDSPTVLSQLDPKAKAGTFRPLLTLPTAAPEAHVAKGTPEEAKTLEQAKALYSAFEGKKEADVLALVTDDTTMDDFTMPATTKGTKGMKEYANSFWKTFPDLAQVKPVQFAAGDYVVTEGTFTGTQKGPMGPIKATNKPVSMRFVDIFQFKDGKVVHGDSFGNSAEILVAVGAMQPPVTTPPVIATAAVHTTSAAQPTNPATK